MKLHRLSNAKAILVKKKSSWTYCLGDKGVHIFPEGICPKVNIIVQMVFKFAYYDVAALQVSPYATGTPPSYSEGLIAYLQLLITW